MAKVKQFKAHKYVKGKMPCLVVKAKCGHYVAAHALEIEDLGSQSVKDFIQSFRHRDAQFEIRPVSFVHSGGLALDHKCKI